MRCCQTVEVVDSNVKKTASFTLSRLLSASVVEWQNNKGVGKILEMVQRCDQGSQHQGEEDVWRLLSVVVDGEKQASSW